MKISEFRAGLIDLESAMRKWSGSKSTDGLNALIEALGEFDDRTIPELAKLVKAINAPPRAGAQSKEPNMAAVERSLTLLEDAAHSSEAFELAIERVLADRTLRANSELLELARRFGGGKPEKTSKSAIAAYLKSRRLEMRRGEGLGVTIDRMFGRH